MSLIGCVSVSAVDLSSDGSANNGATSSRNCKIVILSELYKEGFSHREAGGLYRARLAWERSLKGDLARVGFWDPIMKQWGK